MSQATNSRSRTHDDPGDDLQFGFSIQHAQVVFDRPSRQQKAMKTLAILMDHLGPLDEFTALDLGCAAGNSTVWYGPSFKRVVGVDIDHDALRYARQNNGGDNIAYAMMNGQELAFSDQSFDVIICAHVYEHVPDAHLLLTEIGRLLKPGGVCFFSAGNRLSLMEPHYRLPLLSIMPRFLSHLYLRATKRGHHYYEKHLTYWQLRKLVRPLAIHDYTARVVEAPEIYRAEDVLPPGSMKQRFARLLLHVAFWACPTYLWVLEKRREEHSLT